MSHAVPVIILEKLGQVEELPQNQTKVAQFRRSNPFAPALVPLVEGVTPPGSDFSYTTLSAQIQQYGDYSGLTDVVKDTSKDKVLRDILKRQSEQVAETREKLDWDIVRAGTSVGYGGGKTSRATVDQTSLMSIGMQRQATRILKRNKAKRFTEVLDGSPNYASRPVEACYIAVAHTDLESQLRDLHSDHNTENTFTVVSRYGSVKPVSRWELGTFENVRYITSPDLPPFAGGGATLSTQNQALYEHTSGKADVYPIVFLGREAFGCIPLRGKRAVRPMILNPDTPRGGDPLGQRGSAGWKMYYCCMVLNEAWMRRVEVIATKENQ